MPVFGIAGNRSFKYVKTGLPYIAKDCNVVGLLEGGHYMNEEKPERVLEESAGVLN